MSKSRYRQRFTDDEMEMLFRENATNEEIEAKVSSPRYWTYIVRHPNGFVVCHGRGRSRQTCERNAVRLAGRFAEELFWADERRPLGRWRFVLWPPRQRTLNG
jgi:hypothetical protein